MRLGISFRIAGFVGILLLVLSVRVPVAWPGVPRPPRNTLDDVYRAVGRVAKHGTVPRHLIFTRARASRVIETRADEIFGNHARRIRTSWHQSELYIQSYEWQRGAGEVKQLLGALKEAEAQRKQAGLTAPMVVRIIIDQKPPAWMAVPLGVSTQGDTAAIMRADLAEADLDPRYVRVEARVYRHAGLGAHHPKGLAGEDWVRFESSNIQKHPPFLSNTAFEFEGRHPVEAFKADFYWYWERSDPITERTMVARWVGRSRRGTARAFATLRSDLSAPRAKPDGPEDGSSIMTVTHKPRSLPGGHDNPRDAALYGLLDGAERELNLLQQHLNSRQVKKRILDAVARGTKVNVLLPYGFDIPMQRLAEGGSADTPPKNALEQLERRLTPLVQRVVGGRNDQVVAELYREIENRGLDVALLDIRWYRNLDVQATELNPRVLGVTHARYISADRRMAMSGSSVFHTQSDFSGEKDFVIDDREVVGHWDDTYFWPHFRHGIPARPPT